MKLILATVLTLNIAVAQTSPAGRALSAEYSLPFGTSNGQLLMLGKYLVYVDSQQPESSFVLPRNSIVSADSQASTVTLQTSEPVHNRAGDVTQLSFRVMGDPTTVVNWFHASPQTADRTETTGQSTQSVEATHDHFIGSSHGRLVISPGQLAYESVDDPGDSRRWAYSSIRELTQPNPYEIHIRPYSGDEYKLKLGGSGMDPGTFSKLVDSVAKARATEQPR